MNWLLKFAAIGLSTWVWCSPAGVSLAQEYKSYQEARNAGMRLAREKQFAEAQAPLETALKLAPDDKARLDVYQALMSVYRVLPEIDKKLEANEYVIRHSERRTARGLACRDLVAFLFQRGKLDSAIERYEALLKKEPNDVAGLAMMTEIYKRARPDARQAEEFGTRLEAVERELARTAAQQMEKAAEASATSMASQLKDAAQLWLEAGDKAQAVAVAKRSASSPPEARSELLTFYWHEGLGDVFLSAGEPKLAVTQFEQALQVVKVEGQRKATDKKLAEAKEAAALQ
jgi:tetratricopeptide (TPR) repeat protein